MKVSVQVVLINKEGEILAVSRKDNHKDFGLPGGKVDPEDTTYESAAIREVKEETGLDITNLQLIFSMHKDGYMGYTYLADYSGEINYDEPHVVKWTSLSVLVDGSFGRWNKLVGESLDGMGVKYRRAPMPSEPWMFSILDDEYHDYPIVIVAPLKYWNKNKVVPYPFSGKQSRDLYNICQNGNIGLGELDETSFDVTKNNKLLLTNDEVITALTDAGFLYLKGALE